MDADKKVAVFLIKGGTLDYRAIALRLADYDMELFAKFAGIVTTSWIVAARALLERAEIIPAIKAIRAAKGCGLWEAKQIIDAYRDGQIRQYADRWDTDMHNTLRELKFG